ncbi:hypothetical protein, partial [Streptomyces sp. NPDC090080]|uniref:hypothetical protein n=1 Tax=Streptomyces sp. NPDC090080 TaxID=3365939 RepID=UPI003827CDFA
MRIQPGRFNAQALYRHVDVEVPVASLLEVSPFQPADWVRQLAWEMSEAPGRRVHDQDHPYHQRLQ